jgi:hypothetical protein
MQEPSGATRDRDIVVDLFPGEGFAMHWQDAAPTVRHNLRQVVKTHPLGFSLSFFCVCSCSSATCFLFLPAADLAKMLVESSLIYCYRGHFSLKIRKKPGCVDTHREIFNCEDLGQLEENKHRGQHHKVLRPELVDLQTVPDMDVAAAADDITSRRCAEQRAGLIGSEHVAVKRLD